MTGTITLSEIISNYKSSLKDLYTEDEIRNFCFLSAEHLLNYSKMDFHSKAMTPISEEIQKKFNNILKRIQNWEPIQYILGETEFYELSFRVDQRVMIPRPETEELVHLIIQNEKDKIMDLLDIGTGSGCIAVTLDKHLEKAKVFACDVSEEILDVARINNTTHNAKVGFFVHDVLQDNINLSSGYDVVVSNPPYVRYSERRFMLRNVLDFEPEAAIFVPDDDPLLFYRHIATISRAILHHNGRLYLEINEAFPYEVCRLLEFQGFRNINIEYC